MEHGVRAVQAIARSDSKAAAKLYSEFLALRNVWTPASRFIGADRLLALLARTADEPEMAARHFDESIAFCKKAGTLPELAWTYHDYVAFQIARGGRVDRSAAVHMLDDGLEITAALGMVPLDERLHRLRDEVLAASEVPVYPDGLTRREIEVLRLIAAGRSNREIAEELVITENTGAKHVANILSKTASANRVEAANYASAKGLL
ncbi:MAG: helix-turn-helix transcriptional regulator [Chloroflexi bacterium]|nr:helix-turn-helix transcriptional regulator [Chloroflexota bacterium]